MFDFSKFFHRRPTSLQLSFFGLLIFIFVMILSINAGKNAIESKGQLNKVKDFNVIAKWVGTNGEVVENFILYGDLLYAAVGEKGIYVFKKETLEFITNIIIESNELKYNIKRLDILRIKDNNFFVASFLNGAGEGEKGFILFSFDLSNDVSNVKTYFVDFLNSENFCVVDNKAYFLSKNKEILEFEFDEELKEKVSKYKVNVVNSGIIKSHKNYFYIPSYEDGLYIFRFYKGRFDLVSKIYSEISYLSDCYIYNDKLVLSDRMLGVMIYNISDASRPRLLFHYDTSGDAFFVVMNRNNIYVADGINGVLSIEYKNREINLSKIYKTTGVAEKLFFDEKKKLLFVSFGVNGLYILR